MSRVYLAGASSERTLVSSYMRRLEAAGHFITKDWCADVDANVAAGRTDADLSLAERQTHATADCNGIEDADIFWLLAPTNASTGAWVEFGYALGLLKCTIVSGAHRRTIFGSLANATAEDHEAAFAWILEQREPGSSAR